MRVMETKYKKMIKQGKDAYDALVKKQNKNMAT